MQLVYQYSSCTALLLAVQYICLQTVALHPCFLCTRQLVDYHICSVLHSDATRHLLPVLAMNLSTRFERQQVDQLLAKLSLGTMYICKLFTSSHAPSQNSSSKSTKQFTVEFIIYLIISCACIPGADPRDPYHKCQTLLPFRFFQLFRRGARGGSGVDTRAMGNLAPLMLASTNT